MPDIKCYSCPHKGPILLSNAVQCPGCEAYYHDSCSKPDRAGRLPNGALKKCCGSSRSVSPLPSTPVITSLDELYAKLQVLSANNTKHLEDKISSLQTRLDNYDTKIDGALERLDEVERKLDDPLHSAQLTQELYSEFKDRTTRANQIIMYGVTGVAASVQNSASPLSSSIYPL